MFMLSIPSGQTGQEEKKGLKRQEQFDLSQ